MFFLEFFNSCPPLADNKGTSDEKGKVNGATVGVRTRPFRPEDLPDRTDESSEQVAFQADIRTPWKLMGLPSVEGTQFKWQAQAPSAVSAAVKADVRRILSSYAKQYGIQLSGAEAVKLALHRNEANRAYWISFAGGISSAKSPDM
eukprot:gnl/TRDRNA2_/TRDRNA2_177783_c0_seq14.p1 gnl/TRDRNA2_/TRDRNA2_177783_c0~~gnl/TRDRNA2_/TRDRNA2_177783_c0_seq14.p1  ORF type:complete len:146 (+),score=20.04 gnl/TRDRNA2_/TRDRNA2_177783_c0_seq14:77-514(+)